MQHKLTGKNHGLLTGVSTGFAFAGGTPALEGTGERSSSGDFQERDIPVHACKLPLPALCPTCKNPEKHNTENHKSRRQNPLLITALICISGGLILSSCSSICRKNDLAQRVLEKEHQVLLDLKSDGENAEITRRVAKDPVLRSRESRLRSAIQALIESNEAVRKAF